MSTDTFRISGIVRFGNGIPAARTKVAAYDRDLRSEQFLGEAQTDRNGVYRIQYSERQFLNLERGTADLVVKALVADGSVLVASPVLCNAPQEAKIDLTISLERQVPPTLFERIESAVEPLRGPVSVEELEENQEHQDLTFLAGETSVERRELARFVLAHGLVRMGIDREFWFALLGGSFFEFAEKKSLKENLAAVSDALPSLDATAVRKALASSLNKREIPARLRERTDAWTAAFLELVARLVLGDASSPTFVRMALDHAGIDNADKQATLARLFNQYRALTSELLTALEKERSFKKKQIADPRTSYQLAAIEKRNLGPLLQAPAAGVSGSGPRLGTQDIWFHDNLRVQGVLGSPRRTSGEYSSAFGEQAAPCGLYAADPSPITNMATQGASHYMMSEGNWFTLDHNNATLMKNLRIPAGN